MRVEASSHSLSGWAAVMDGDQGPKLTASNAGSLILPYLTDSSYPYFTSHLTTLRPLTTISLYRQDGSIRGVLLTRRPEQSVSPLTRHEISG